MAHSLSKDERLQCDRRSEALLSETLAALAGFDSSRLDPTEWRLLARRGQVAVHRALSANHGAAGTHRRRAVGSGFLDGTLNDIVGGLYVENDADLLTTQALLSPSGNTVADAAVLLIEERRQPRAAPFRFAGVKWYSWKKKLSAGQNANGAGQKANAAANLSVDSQECDLLTYERMGMALTEDRGTGGMQELVYHVQLSLHKPEWPLDVARGPGLRRAEMAMCFLYRKVSDDLVECFTLVDYDSRVSATSRRTADSEVADRVLMVTRLPDCARAKVFSTFANKVKGRPVMMSKMCLRCGSKRKVLDLLRTCCICKKSVCQKCFELKPVFSVNSRTHEPETDAFCNKCITRIEIMRAAKNTTANKTSGSTDGGSSTSGSSKDRDKENNSGGSTGSSSKKTFKFWRKSKDKLQANQEQVRTERERRRHSLPASTKSHGMPHGPNYDALFRNYDVFGCNEHRPELDEEQEPEKEQESAEPQPEARRRQTTFLADPDIVAAEAANRGSLLKSSKAPSVARDFRDKTVAEVYPMAKTVLETEDIYTANADENPHNEAERAHFIYVERRQRLNECQDQPRYGPRGINSNPLPLTDVETQSKDAKAPARKSYRVPDIENRPLRSKSAPPELFNKKPAAPVGHRYQSRREGGQSHQQPNEDDFRMDLYGRF